MTKIGVWNTAFLGDAILTLPLLQTLREAYPDAEIDFWVRKGFAPLFASHPAVTRVLEYDKRGKDKGAARTFGLGLALGRADYSMWISAHSSVRSGLLARWSSAKIRIGYDRPLYNAWLYTHTISRKFGELDEIERLNRLLLPLKLERRGVAVQTWPSIVLPKTAVDAAASFFESLSPSPGSGERPPVLGVHPGSIWGTKRWPEEYYAEVTARAVRAGAVALVFGGPGEEGMARDVALRAREALSPGEGERVVNLAGRLSLPELAAYIGRLDCYASNDSGPMHLAWPQGVPVTAMFGPTVRDWGFFPKGGNAAVMEIPLSCRPCGLHGPQTCPLGHHRCMRDLTPDMVWPDIAAKLFKTRPNAGGE